MSSNNTRICTFVSVECNGIISLIGDNILIPETNTQLIKSGMFLCRFHYNKYIVNEKHRLERLQKCSHPKHDIYSNQSNKKSNQNQKISLVKVPKRLISILKLEENAKFCNSCKKNTDKDPEYLQTEEYQAPIPIKQNEQ